MEHSGEYGIAATRAEVWAGLADRERVKGCLVRCQSLTQTGPLEFAVQMDPAVIEDSAGSLQSQLGVVRLTEVDAPNRCCLRVGPGSAVVQLEEAGESTRLTYRAEGLLAEAPAAALADDFFAQFAAGFAPGEGHYQPSQQWIIWAIMFGVLLLAVVLTI